MNAKNVTPLEIIAAIDAALTLANRLTQWLEQKRELGELTPEESDALDALIEQKASKWNAGRKT